MFYLFSALEVVALLIVHLENCKQFSSRDFFNITKTFWVQLLPELSNFFLENYAG